MIKQKWNTGKNICIISDDDKLISMATWTTGPTIIVTGWRK